MHLLCFLYIHTQTKYFARFKTPTRMREMGAHTTNTHFFELQRTMKDLFRDNRTTAKLLLFVCPRNPDVWLGRRAIFNFSYFPAPPLVLVFFFLQDLHWLPSPSTMATSIPRFANCFWVKPSWCIGEMDKHSLSVYRMNITTGSMLSANDWAMLNKPVKKSKSSTMTGKIEICLYQKEGCISHDICLDRKWKGTMGIGY